MSVSVFIPTRQAGLARLDGFVARAGSHYAAQRNFDFGPENRVNVSTLSPYIRHRLILEEEVVKAVLDRHSFNAASKFIQEVCWRTYWKGWLEMRPQVWRDYQAQVADLTAELGRNGGLRKGYTQATEGRTGIEPFEAWTRELIDHGYVHNHARMWFASIWIFTLGLPWELGADFFFRHLHDGDPASNTLSWRWVAGLHTAGKTYLARADNIETYTQGRFRVEAGQLARNATPLGFGGHPTPMPLAEADMVADGETILIVTEEDCRPETLPLGGARVVAVAALDPAFAYHHHAAPVLAFKRSAVADAAARAAEHFNCAREDIGGETFVADVKALAGKMKCANAATAYLPVGPLRDKLAPVIRELAGHGIAIRQVRRDWDSAFWPHATHGFFKLKEKIPAVLSRTVLRAA